MAMLYLYASYPLYQHLNRTNQSDFGLIWAEFSHQNEEIVVQHSGFSERWNIFITLFELMEPNKTFL